MKQILIVDDSATARMFIKRCLEIAGCRETTFTEAANGEEALALLKELSVNLVVSDLVMPVMDGKDLLRRISASPRLNGVPVLIVSSVKNPAKEKELLDLGAYAVLGKPISPAILMQTIESLLSPNEGVE